MTRETDPLLKNRQQPQPQPLVKSLFKKLLTIIIPLSLIIISSYYIMTHHHHHHHQNDPNNTDGPILTLRLYTNNIRFDNKITPINMNNHGKSENSKVLIQCNSIHFKVMAILFVYKKYYIIN